MGQGIFDEDRVATIHIAMDNDLSMALDRVAEVFGLTYGEAAELGLGVGLAALESEWGQRMLKKLRAQGPR